MNSIKTARRVDGLLRALGLNSRAIHAQLQQRQRLRALESYRAAPVGILVATDVAARGLDIPKITSVLHYDIARSPQVCLCQYTMLLATLILHPLITDFPLSILSVVMMDVE